MKKVLITGFEPFGDYVVNPTEWLASYVDTKVIAGYEVHSLVISKQLLFEKGERNTGELVIKKAQEVGAEIIISFGIASDVKGFRFEQSSINWIYNEKYCSKEENNTLLDSREQEKKKRSIDFSPWDFEAIKQRCKESGLLCEDTISVDAGAYICNALIYRTLQAMEKEGLKIPYLFIHTACTEESVRTIITFDREKKVLIKNEDLLTMLWVVLGSKR